MKTQDSPPRAQAVGKTTLRSNIVSDVKTLSGIELFVTTISFLPCVLNKNVHAMNGVKRKTQESHECQRQRTPSSEAT